MKIIYCLVIGLFLSAGGVLLQPNSSPFQQPTAAEIQRIEGERLARVRYREEIDRARAEGKTAVLLPAASSIPSPITSVEEIMRSYGLLRVKVIDKETTVYEPDADIKTWCKVEIVDTLHQQDKISDNPLPDGIPSRFLPLLPSESILIVSGGEITVDGFRVIRAISSDEVDYIPNEEYLIASHLDYSGKIIFPAAQAAGVFHIKNTDLKPLGHKQHQLVREVKEIYGNNLDRFRSDIQLRLQGRNK